MRGYSSIRKILTNEGQLLSHNGQVYYVRSSDYLKATNRGKLLYLGPRMVALIISLLGHFSSWNLIIKLKVMELSEAVICQ